MEEGEIQTNEIRCHFLDMTYSHYELGHHY
jgi:hypothetical protein